MKKSKKKVLEKDVERHNTIGHSEIEITDYPYIKFTQPTFFIHFFLQ